MDLTPAIRTARPGDLDALREIFRRSSLSNPGDRDALLAHPEVLVWPGDGIATGRTRVAVDADGTPVGFASTLPAGDDVELDDLFVDPDRMRQGIARALVEDLAGAARRAGASNVRVVANEHAAAFYAAVGFVPDGVAQTRFGPAPRLRRPLG